MNGRFAVVFVHSFEDRSDPLGCGQGIQAIPGHHHRSVPRRHAGFSPGAADVQQYILPTGERSAFPAAWVACALPAGPWCPLTTLRKRIASFEAQTELAASTDFAPGE